MPEETTFDTNLLVLCSRNAKTTTASLLDLSIPRYAFDKYILMVRNQATQGSLWACIDEMISAMKNKSCCWASLWTKKNISSPLKNLRVSKCSQEMPLMAFSVLGTY